MENTSDSAGTIETAIDRLRGDDAVPVLVLGDQVRGVAHPHARIHPLTLAMMEVLGVDVAAVRRWGSAPLLWAASEDMRLDQGPQKYMMGEDGEISLFCNIGLGLMLHHDLILRCELPETIVDWAKGRPLREIVSSNLDHIDLHILAAHNANGRTRFTVIPSDGATPLRVDLAEPGSSTDPSYL